MGYNKLLSPWQLLSALFSATASCDAFDYRFLKYSTSLVRGAVPRPFLGAYRLHLCRRSDSRAGLQISCLVLMVLLAGCGNNDFSDLNRYLSEVKARPKEPIKPLPEIKVIEPFMFKSEGLRDPFKPLEQPEQDEGVDVSTGSGIKPDTTRRKEELETFPLDVLRMVGTVDMKSSLWGLVKANDRTIYRVKVGNYIGKNYGKIIRIVSDKIELMEIVPDKPGTWREQPASIALAE